MVKFFENLEDVVSQQIKDRNDINKIYKNGKTLLHIAIKKGNLQIVRDLLKHGVIVSLF